MNSYVDQEAIFEPMLGVVVLTVAVWIYMFARRIPAIQSVGKPPQAFSTPDKVAKLIPEQANLPANNFKNLLELPVLFYVLCLYLYVTEGVDTLYLYAAWTFFAFRVAHSVVHCTFNRVMLRFQLYCGGAIAFLFMLARAVIDAF